MILNRRLAIALCLILASILPAAAQTHTAKVTFVLVNDIYQMSEQTTPDGRSRGGFARLAAVVKAERARGGRVIFAHAGDTLSPSLMSGIDHGAHIIQLTNMIPPDIFVPGNHEFDFGKETFLKRMSEAKFPLFAANLRTAGGAPLKGFRDHAIIDVDGIRLGLTGAAADDSPVKSSPGDLGFAPAVETVTAEAAALRRDGADFVVAVVHADRRKDAQLFQSRAVDLILTGDDHDLYLDYDGRTAIVESSSDAHYVTAIDIAINVDIRGSRRVMTWWPQFRIIDTANVEPDPAVTIAVKEFEEHLSREMDVAIATTVVELDSRSASVRTREAAIGNLFADALRGSTGADIAITNGGGIRANKIYHAGSDITRRDILSELVFGNHVALLAVSGRDIKAALENGLSAAPEPSGRFPHISGMTVTADLSKAAGHRVTSIRIDGKPLDEARTYRLATNDFLARGGDGYTVLGKAARLTRDYDGPLMANAVMVYLRKLGIIRTGIEDRIILK